MLFQLSTQQVVSLVSWMNKKILGKLGPMKTWEACVLGYFFNVSKGWRGNPIFKLFLFLHEGRISYWLWAAQLLHCYIQKWTAGMKTRKERTNYEYIKFSWAGVRWQGLCGLLLRLYAGMPWFACLLEVLRLPLERQFIYHFVFWAVLEQELQEQRLLWIIKLVLLVLMNIFCFATVVVKQKGSSKHLQSSSVSRVTGTLTAQPSLRG